MKVSSLTLWLATILAPLVSAQEFIALNEEDIARLGIVFAPITNPDRQSGDRFPATVINSPDSVSEIIMPFQGTLLRWHVMPGTFVHQGQVLAEIRSQEITELQNEWLTTNAQLEQAEFLLRRDQSLLEQGIVSRQRVEETQRIATHAQIDLNALGSTLNRAGFDADTLEKLELEPDRLGLFTLNAPASGTLNARLLTAGQFAEKYQPVASLGGTGQPWLRIEVPARYAQSMEPGIVLNLRGIGDSVTVRYRDLRVHESTQTVQVLAEFNGSVSYLPGQILGVLIPPGESGALIPGGAVVHNGDETVAFFRTSGGVEARTLVLEPAGSNYIAGPGVQIGEQVVIQGAAVLKGIQLGLGQSE